MWWLIKCRKKNAPDQGPIFQCLAMLTTAVGPYLTRQMHDVLELMLPWGLSDPLYHALEVISTQIPPLLRTIQGEHHQSVARGPAADSLQSDCSISCR